MTLFKTLESAQRAIEAYIDAKHPNKFQDAMTISRMKIVEYRPKTFVIQLASYGSFL